MEMKGKLINIYLFNCDNTCSLDPIESLFLTVQKDAKMRFAVGKRNFRLHEMTQMCETVIPGLQMDFAIFAVNAHESRLSINEDNAGIGYAKIYRALLKATGGKVLIVIGGDSNYKDSDEEDRYVISRWARRKVASQFGEEYLDGRQSFIFSWNMKHREIHEQALLHYFDPSKTGKKFEYQPKPKPQPKLQPMPQPKPPLGMENTTDSVPFTTGKRDTKIDLEEPGPYPVPSYYPEGTVLLHTRLRYGRISFEVGDVKTWDRAWMPSEKIVQDLVREWGKEVEVNVQFISTGSGGVTYTVSRAPPEDGGSCRSSLIAITLLCVAGLVIFGIWRLTLVYNQPRMPDQPVELPRTPGKF